MPENQLPAFSSPATHTALLQAAAEGLDVFQRRLEAQRDHQLLEAVCSLAVVHLCRSKG